MSDFLMKPKIDFAFKEIMENEKARTGFLAAVLQLDPKDIKETRILNTNLRKAHENDKLGILDVRILMNDDTHIDTEIQLSELKIWGDRALFYISRMYTDQIEKGQNYDVLKKWSVSVSWTLCCLKTSRNFIPASTSWRTPAISSIPTKWNFMSSNFQNLKKMCGKTPAAWNYGQNLSMLKNRRNLP